MSEQTALPPFPPTAASGPGVVEQPRAGQGAVGQRLRGSRQARVWRPQASRPSGPPLQRPASGSGVLDSGSGVLDLLVGFACFLIFPDLSSSPARSCPWVDGRSF